MKNTENTLKLLFDYHRFEPNARLSALVKESEQRNAEELSDDDLSLVAAAGEPNCKKPIQLDQ